MRHILSIILLVTFFSTSQAQETTLHEDLNLKYLVQLPSNMSAHPPILFLMHGYGSNEGDLFELRKFFPANFIIISIRAPFTVNSNGYQWYSMTKTNGHHDGKKEDMDNSRDLIIKFIKKAVEKFHADPKSVYISGFSQGAMMSYYTGLYSPSLFKGIAPLSGMIVPGLKPEIKITPALKQLKIFITHGTADDRIPFTDGKSAYEYLLGLGLKPEFHQYEGMGHQISKNVIDDLTDWLKK